jgi:predicted ester cyclase
MRIQTLQIESPPCLSSGGMPLSDEPIELDAFTQGCVDSLSRWFEEGWRQRNFDLIDDLFAPEFLAEGGASGRLDRLGYKTYCKRIIDMNPDLDTEIIEMVPAGDIVVSRARTWGTHTGVVQGIEPSGKSFETIVTDVWKFDAEGLIVHRTNAEYDFEYFREVLGFVPRFKL